MWMVCVGSRADHYIVGRRRWVCMEQRAGGEGVKTRGGWVCLVWVGRLVIAREREGAKKAKRKEETKVKLSTGGQKARQTT